MPNVGIVTDTDCSLPESIAQDLGIIQVPIHIHFEDQTFQTGLEIDDETLFARVDADGVLPTTSAPSPGEFARAYQEAFDAGFDAVVCICVSGAVSATYDAAINGVDLLPGHDITVIDSRNLSLGQGFMVLAAAQAAHEGASTQEITSRAKNIGKRSHLFASLSTLKYLAMSGRVGHLAAGVANVLDVKPILTIRDGKLDLLERVRTQRKAWNRVAELTAGVIDGHAIERLAIVHVAARDQARAFEEVIRTKLDYTSEILTAELTPGLSVHSGAGMVGAAIIVSE